MSAGPILTTLNGGGQGPGGQYNRLSVAPGQHLNLGAQGGTLLLGPPGAAPGSMSLTDMQNRTWHLLREDGPDTGYVAPTTGDFNITVVTRDLNIALAQFISQTGLAPNLTDRMDNFAVLPLLDYPVPPGLVSLTRIEYTPQGQQTYKLIGCSMTEFDNQVGSVLPPTTGQPYFYREPFAGYIRLSPQPSLGNAQGYGEGTITLTGATTVGEVLLASFNNGAGTVVSVTYTCVAADTIYSALANLSTRINNSAAVVGTNAFLAATAASSNTIQITSLNTPGTSIAFYASITGTSATITPTASTSLVASGDIITFYYSSLGILLVGAGDVPAVPPQFHMAPVYRVLTDYWARKQDFKQSDHYMKMFELEVQRGKSYVFDSQRSTGPTIAGEDNALGWRVGGG